MGSCENLLQPLNLLKSLRVSKFKRSLKYDMQKYFTVSKHLNNRRQIFLWNSFGFGKRIYIDYIYIAITTNWSESPVYP